MEKLINKSSSAGSIICESCKKKESIVKITFKRGELSDDRISMNVCANCRDNLDDDIILEEYIDKKVI
jgi:protein-arginine kinase activator protein McsA